MANPGLPVETLQEAVDAYVQFGGNKADAARHLNLPYPTYRCRLEAAKLSGIVIPEINRELPKGRLDREVFEGTVFIFGDAHYWPGEPSTAHRAFVKLSKKYKPKLVVCHGDVVDGSSISRHPPIGWESCPTVKEELGVCQTRLKEIEKANPNAEWIWLLGNHDTRFETRLAQVAPEFKHIHGIHLHDHFPNWTRGMTLFIGDERGVVVKHNFKGGVHATHNNAMHSGRTMVTGHLHSARVTPFTDYNGTRYGVDTGCLADIYHEAFQGYCADNPRNWRSGFCVLTFKEGMLLMPELVTVVDEGRVQFRGELIDV